MKKRDEMSVTGRGRNNLGGMCNFYKTACVAACMAAVFLSGCGGTGENGNAEPSEVVQSTETQSTETQSTEAKGSSVIPHSQYDRAAFFADAVYDQNGQSNIMVSPMSLDMALGLLSGGTRGRTRAELDNYLGTSDYGAFAEQYLKDREDSPVTIANSIWVRNDRKLVKAYKNLAKKQYGAEIEAVSFEQKDIPGTVERINAWGEEKTNGMIPKILTQESVTPDTATVLVNSLYFESAWEKEWKVSLHTFTNFAGEEKTEDMLYDMVSEYYENDVATAFSKDYQDGLCFVGILPKKEGEFTLEELQIEALMDNRITKYDVYARMPKLNYETTANGVENILKSRGVETVFDPEHADLTGLIEKKEGVNTYVSSIIQKTKLELDEKKTKAAAVTAIIAKENSAMPVERDKREVFLDRPFAFLIYDRNSDQILFIGKVVDI